ncbi:outer dynein arm-docking complex subunit 4 isoform X1 [Drosophila kikkawai]|uniref:Outer dynein arm-docking complex subunit 4 isoform X1 n=1 Tax=Drosophila kikkawai TaxID=30033 RepID=A0A6P4JLT9_DROKI|nr:uncharacterized protein LOC108084091 [Drosophila kikkawai]
MSTRLSVSESLQVPAAAVKPHLRPWEIAAWSPDRQASIHSDWGMFFSRQRRFSTALGYVDNSLDLEPFNARALVRRSQLKRTMGLAPEALKDCAKAEDLLLRRQPPVISPHISLEVSDALYESNRLEDTKMKLHGHLRRFSSVQAIAAAKRLNVLGENYHDVLSDETTIPVQRMVKRMMDRLANQPKEVKDTCDVVSITEKEERHLSPLEKARRDRYFKIYSATYLNKAWVDVEFLKKLRSDPNVHPEHWKESSVHLKKLLESNYKSARTLTKMLHTRCPMYALHQQKYPNEALYNKQKDENLYRIQHQTRRNIYKILRTIRLLIRAGELDKLTVFIEGVMGDYVTTKTQRLMPWKFEFTNEVYNYLGLARINEYKTPSKISVQQGRQRLLALFRLPNKNTKAENTKRPNTLNIPRSDTTDPKAEKFMKQAARLENRMRFAEYPLERAYLLHELAQAHLEYNSFDAACSMARRALDEADQCNSDVWSFLSLMVICKSHAILGKVERLKDTLAEALSLAKKMKNLNLCLFIEICIRVNLEEMDLKRLTSIEWGSKRHRSSGLLLTEGEDRDQIA